jgi:hypothetical protein
MNLRSTTISFLARGGKRADIHHFLTTPFSSPQTADFQQVLETINTSPIAIFLKKFLTLKIIMVMISSIINLPLGGDRESQVSRKRPGCAKPVNRGLFC